MEALSNFTHEARALGRGMHASEESVRVVSGEEMKVCFRQHRPFGFQDESNL